MYNARKRNAPAEAADAFLSLWRPVSHACACCTRHRGKRRGGAGRSSLFGVLKLVFLGIHGKVGLKALVIAGLYGVEIFVRIKFAPVYLGNAYGDVGAVVAYPFAVVQKIVQYKAKLYGAAPLLQPFYVLALYLAYEHVYNLLKRLHLGGLLKIVVDKGVHSKREYLLQCIE